MEQFAEILKDLILDKNTSLRSLAKECGVSATQLSGYLRGVTPSLQVAIKLVKYFDCTLDYLFGLSEEKNYCIISEFSLKKFIANYEKLLKKNKISHWKFCQKYELSEASLRHWKNGDIPSMNSLVIIAFSFGESIDNLIK